MASFVVERVGPGAWERVRAVRLRALAEAPDAFGTTLAEDRALAPDAWCVRLADPAAATFLAHGEGRDLGLVVGGPYESQEGAAGLFALWVAPEARGRGVARALVEAVVSWARAGGRTRVVLEVGDRNAPAVRLYAGLGFVPTGRTGSLPPPRGHILEHERERRL